MTPEEKAELERKRREARKNRIQNHAGGRLGFIAEQVKDPTQEPIKKDLDDNEDGEENVFNNNGIMTPPDNKKNNNNNQQQQQQQTNNNNIFERRRHLPEHSRSLVRWFGIVMFTLLFASSTIILASGDESLRDSHPTYRYFGKYLRAMNAATASIDDPLASVLGGHREFLLCTAPLVLFWAAWEYIICYTKVGPFFPMFKSDTTVIAFLYTVVIDLTLRFSQQLKIIPAVFQATAGDHLIPALYVPLIFAFVAQFVIKAIPSQLPIVNMNDMIRRGFESIANIVVMVATLLVCIDWWECNSILCKEIGLLWLISNKSRGLLLWSYLCNNFASRIIP